VGERGEGDGCARCIRFRIPGSLPGSEWTCRSEVGSDSDSLLQLREIETFSRYFPLSLSLSLALSPARAQHSRALSLSYYPLLILIGENQGK